MQKQSQNWSGVQYPLIPILINMFFSHKTSLCNTPYFYQHYAFSSFLIVMLFDLQRTKSNKIVSMFSLILICVGSVGMCRCVSVGCVGYACLCVCECFILAFFNSKQGKANKPCRNCFESLI